MLNSHKRKSAGFTLIELAIVLGIAGILFGGLWRLLSTSNTQMRDQATATHHQQIVNAVASYLQSSGEVTDVNAGGQGFLSGMSDGEKKALKLPDAATPAGDASCSSTGDIAASNPGLCNFLPPGFHVNSTNPYGQIYSIMVWRQNTQTYSFMVLTTGGDAIPDTSGGRISAMIGGDGGFLYGTDVCGTPVATTACGSFGGWSAIVTTDFGFAASPGVGHIASRTYNGGSLALGSWLARKKIPGDTVAAADASPEYNTMHTDLFLGGNNQNFYFGNNIETDPAQSHWGTGANSTLFLQGGQIDLGGGKTSALSGIIIGSHSGGAQPPFIRLKAPATTPTDGTANPFIHLEGPGSGFTALQIVSGDLYLSNGVITSPTFTYSSSDARLKTNIKPITDALANVMKINPVTFVFKSNGKKSMGVIAQDLEKIYPQLVLDGKDGLKSVGYEGLIAPLIGSVQELKKENDDLRTQLREQANRQEKLEKEIESLRKK